MPIEPANKAAVAFIDGQNLFHSAKDAFGYTFPNYDVSALATAVCVNCGWNLVQVRFYTGVRLCTTELCFHDSLCNRGIRCADEFVIGPDCQLGNLDTG